MSSSLNVKLCIKKCTLASYVVLGMRSAGTPPNGKQTVSPSRQCSSTPGGVGHGFLLMYPTIPPHQNCHTRSCSTHQNHIVCPLNVYHFISNVGPHPLQNKFWFTEMSRATTSLKGIIWATTSTSACRDWGKSLKSSHYFHKRSYFLLCRKHTKMKSGQQ